MLCEARNDQGKQARRNELVNLHMCPKCFLPFCAIKSREWHKERCNKTIPSYLQKEARTGTGARREQTLDDDLPETSDNESDEEIEEKIRQEMRDTDSDSLSEGEDKGQTAAH